MLALLFFCLATRMAWTFASPLPQCDQVSPNQQLLDDGKNQFALKWEITPKQTIRLRLSANLENGWLGMGLSEAGHMVGSDVISVGFSPDNVPWVEDGFVPWKASPHMNLYPMRDACQSWVMHCAWRNETSMAFLVERALISNDTEDRDFVAGSNRVIYAFGRDATRASYYHGPNRGGRSIDFQIEPSWNRASTLPTDMDAHTEYRMGGYNMSFRTEYIQQKFDLGVESKHVVAARVVIPEADRPFVHHMIVHDCGTQDGIIPLNLLSFSQPVKIGLQESGNSIGFGACQGMVYGFALGGNEFKIFPLVAGYRIGASSLRFMVIEIHLDNPALVKHTISAGVTLYTTSKFRQHDMGSLALGDPAVLLEPISPGLSRAHFEMPCPAACTSTFKGEIHLVGSGPHMHLHGREIWTTLYDQHGGQVDVSRRKFWNFATQVSMDLNLTVRPGDRLSTHCVFDTSKSTTPVPFGLDSNEEMCIDFIMYYPKENGQSMCGYYSSQESLCGMEMLFPSLLGELDHVQSVPDNTGEGNAGLCFPSSSMSTPPDLVRFKPEIYVLIGLSVVIVFFKLMFFKRVFYPESCCRPRHFQRVSTPESSDAV